MEAIVLAGGMGTRLQSVVSHVPKPMADINGKPFLEYLLKYLSDSGITKVVLSVGYKSDVIFKHFGSRFANLQIAYAEEHEPLGTGGAVVQSLNYVNDSDVFLLNGDTFFALDLQQLYQVHQTQHNDVTLALKPMKHFDRYGAVTLIEGKVWAFEEKRSIEQGLINGGVYVLKTSIMDVKKLPTVFSFESDFLEKELRDLQVGAHITDAYFIDIGIPEDYEKAQRDFETISGVEL